MPHVVVRSPEHTRARSLGWLAISWLEHFCIHGPGDIQGRPLSYRRGPDAIPLSDELTKLTVDCYALDDRGNRLYDSAFFSRPKGADKSGHASRIGMFEALGPCRFAGWAKGGEVFEWLDFRHVYQTGEPMGRRVTYPFLRILATEEGQPLALDTRVPTPTGWTTVGALKVGDCVFGSDGRPLPVSRVTPIFYGLDCYEISFSDGERIVASGSHCWTMDRRDLHSGKHERVTVTTAQMATDCRSSYRGSLYRQRLMPAFELPPAELVVDPYFLGLWLGDGRTADSSVAYDMRVHDEVAVLVEELLQPGEEVVYSGGLGNTATFRIRKPGARKSLNSLRNRLRAIGVLGNKHIPLAYLRASKEQRWALLQGLMDSDGTIDRVKGRACFTNINRRLIDDFEDLLTTLGFKWDERFDQGVGAWRVKFQPTAEHPVARLDHKVAAHKQASTNPRSIHRHVKSVKKVPSVPVRCIGIDTADHLFAVGRSAVLTHNTGNVYDAVYYNLKEGPLREAFGRKDDVGLTRVFLPDGGEIRPSTASSSAKDGGKETWANFDETHIYVLPELRRMYDTVRRNMTKRKDSSPWSFETSTMYQPGQDSIAERSHKLADDIRAKKLKVIPRYFFDHREAPAIPDLGAVTESVLRDALKEAYGADWDWQDQDRKIAEIMDPRNEVSDTRRYSLNQATAAYDAWITPQQYDARIRDGYTVAKGALITLGLDPSESDDHTVLVGCEVETGYQWPIAMWNPADESDHRLPKANVDGEVHKAFEDYDVVAFYSDVHPMEDYLDRWQEEFGEKLCAKATERQPIKWYMNQPESALPTKMVEAYHTAIVSGVDLSFAPDRAFRQYHINARRRPNRHGVSFGKGLLTEKMDGAAAGALARKARQDYLGLPDAKKRQKKRKVGVTIV